MKKALIACVSICLVAMTACGSKRVAVEETETEATTTTLPVNVAEKWFEEVTTVPVTEAPIEITTTTSPPETTTEPVTTTEETTTTTFQTVIETVPTTAPAPVIITQPSAPAQTKTVYVYETVTAQPQTVYVTVPVEMPAAPDIHELVPHAEINVADSANLCRFEMDSDFGGNYQFDIRGLTAADFTNDTMIKPYTFDNSLTLEENVDRDYFFEAPLFGPEIIKDKVMKINDVFDGSLFAVETVDRNGDVILNEKFSKLNESQYQNCYVKALHVARFMDKDDIEFTFYKGLHLGMTEAEFYNTVGNYAISAADIVILKNNQNTLLIKFAWGGKTNTTSSNSIWDNPDNSSIRIVDEITLFNNDGVDLVKYAESNYILESDYTDEEYAPWYNEPVYTYEETTTTIATQKEYSWVDDAYHRQFGYNNGYVYYY